MKKMFAGMILWSAALAVSADPVAIVTDALGNHSLNGEALEILSEVSTGDQITVADAGSISLVYYQDGAEFVYMGPAAFEVGENAPKTLSGNDPSNGSAVPEGEGSISTVGLAQAAMVMRAGGSEKRLDQVFPVDTVLLSSPDTFRWRELAEGVGYTFELTDGEGRSLLETTVTGNELKVPSHVTLAAGDYYSWSLESRLPDGKKFSSYAGFSIADDELISRVESFRPSDEANVSRIIVFALWLEQNELVEEARRYWQMASRQRPEDLALRQRAGG
ncbi:MAG: hypothetical protein AAF552_01700 [Pseudomonadota bacterium]